MKNFTIYLRTNTINGKHYVGQTKDFRQREYDWNCLKKIYANKYIDADRELYGIDNFSTEILAECDTREEAWQLEQYYIEHYNTIYPNGYNLSKGGASGANGYHWNHSDETKKKISVAKKGKHFSEEHRKKMSESMHKKQVYQYSLDGELVKVWVSTMECGRNGFHQGAVSQCCRGERKSYKGFIWSYSPLP